MHYREQIIVLQDAELTLWPHVFTDTESAYWLRALQEQILWRQDDIVMFGKTVAIPRLQAWYGDPRTAYQYSGLQMIPNPWTETLLQIKNRIETVTFGDFNSVLINQYRNGDDCVGWHSDDEKELGKQPVIASLSFGAMRRFRMRHKVTKQTYEVSLPAGSVLLMSGDTQTYWQHAILREKKVMEPRINLTFRHVFYE